MLSEHDLEAFGYFDTVKEYEKVKTNADMVYEFHEAFCPDQINGPWSDDDMQLRFDLMEEEFNEALAAWENELHEGYEEAVVKELVDLLYVTYGTLVYLGVDADEAFRRVHESNMSKLGKDGKPIRRADGKVLKGENYKEPDLKDLV